MGAWVGEADKKVTNGRVDLRTRDRDSSEERKGKEREEEKEGRKEEMRRLSHAGVENHSGRSVSLHDLHTVR